MQFTTSLLSTLLFSTTTLAVPLTSRQEVEETFEIINYYTGCVAPASGEGDCQFTVYDLHISSFRPSPYFSVHCTGRDNANDKVVYFTCSETSSSKVSVTQQPAEGGSQDLFASVGWEDHGHLRVATGNAMVPIYPLGPKNFSVPITFVTPPQ